MKKINVVCGVILNSLGQYLLTQRGDKSNYAKWEFPGGKMENAETYTDSIVRELYEELNLKVSAGKILYEDFVVSKNQEIKLIFIECSILEGELTLKEHLSYNWFSIKDLLKIDIIQGDKGFVKQLIDKPEHKV